MAVPPSQFYQSAIWAILTAISFAVMVTAVHYMDGKFDAFQIVFFRAVVGLFMIVPLVFRFGIGTIRTTKTVSYTHLRAHET